MKKFVVVLTNYIYEHPAQVIIIPGGFFLLLVLSLDIIRGIGIDEMLSNLTASVIEVFLLGFIIIAYNKLSERKDRIKRYREEIDAYRSWKEAEATYRICGLVRNLNSLNIYDINLSYCFLCTAPLSEANLEGAFLMKANLQGAHFMEANLQGAYLEEANLQGAILVTANLQGADLRWANLEGANLGGANLEGANLGRANLEGADLTRANLEGAIVESSDWLEKYNIQGIEDFKERYCLVEAKDKWGATVKRITLKTVELP